ncbi:methyltransferase domain-containing protein [Mycobacterium sp. CBMA293]|uniref:CheR family methyltransferase n=1 Tax=unclassified Mycolicibacterium TaxID=2636767 RepID=UPI0012DE0713|nr:MULTISPECIES: CheR family methyltransferase [unclassified Mycolicibacterium]MUL47846.1 methyltransferase domain-containing protein [Mycolicibacterium sp. CBMA 360]MUL59307.1 methyltransferase domain-containing protein [Mycolicibacterium sp. CBMA 335]MUL71032.1 methyltransferase domain-containing protein [Mycolicibacterium sp. CBMA 311]MUL94675.1 methyltransferase domain-containing protein [Mycolicibacterium sp. CBMA 230]MUM09148.1 hypothetical protein [Mycolicibacterium sp. CBMA 213]
MLRDELAPNPILAKAARLQLFGRSPSGFFLRLNWWIWRLLPAGLISFYPVHTYGIWLHRLACLGTRQQQHGTFFLRNRPALELMRRVAAEKSNGSTLRIAVLGCSIGAEVYSVLWTIRRARPDLNVLVDAVDISNEILRFAEDGRYTSTTSELVGASIFERLTPHEMGEMFDWDGDEARAKPWLREAITWHVGDASRPDLVRILGPHDIVVANNFLCHMDPPDAENCLRNIAGVVNQGGYLFVLGVDLDVRAKVARDLAWRPIPELIEQIHDGDPSVREAWPWLAAALEPLNYRRRDWQTRYAAVFRLTEGD